MKVFIVIGGINHGKTRYLRELYESLKEKNIKTGGFTSNGIINKEGLKDFEICNLSDNKSMHLASRNQYPGYIKMNESFYFNPAAIEFGTSILEEALKNKSGVVIIDEIGPIELKEKVWYKSLLKVLKSSVPIILVSVRKGLSHDVIQKFSIQTTVLIDISDTSSSEAAGMIGKNLL